MSCSASCGSPAAWRPRRTPETGKRDREVGRRLLDLTPLPNSTAMSAEPRLCLRVRLEASVRRLGPVRIVMLARLDELLLRVTTGRRASGRIPPTRAWDRSRPPGPSLRAASRGPRGARVDHVEAGLERGLDRRSHCTRHCLPEVVDQFSAPGEHFDEVLQCVLTASAQSCDRLAEKSQSSDHSAAQRLAPEWTVRGIRSPSGGSPRRRQWLRVQCLAGSGSGGGMWPRSGSAMR